MEPRIGDIGLLVTTKYTEENLKPIFYTYVHFRADDGVLFYVGKGKDQRAFSKHSRSKHWQNIVNKHGFKVKIISSNLTEEWAFIEEMKLIEHCRYGKLPLVNKTNGGEGNTSKRSLEWKKNHSEKIKAAFAAGRYPKRLGKNNPFYGKTHSKLTKLKIAKSRAKNAKST